jgi:hypothetical protein
MRKLIMLAAMVALMGTMTAAPAVADEYDDLQSHPLRILAYVIHPVGFTAEWLLTRPFHQIVSQPDLEPVFGHHDHSFYGGGSPVNTDLATPSGGSTNY